MSRMARFNVWFDDRNGRCYLYDTVYYESDFTAPQVRRSLIDHDGYPECIYVYKERADRTMPHHTERINY